MPRKKSTSGRQAMAPHFLHCYQPPYYPTLYHGHYNFTANYVKIEEIPNATNVLNAGYAKIEEIPNSNPPSSCLDPAGQQSHTVTSPAQLSPVACLPSTQSATATALNVSDASGRSGPARSRPLVCTRNTDQIETGIPIPSPKQSADSEGGQMTPEQASSTTILGETVNLEESPHASSPSTSVSLASCVSAESSTDEAGDTSTTAESEEELTARTYINKRGKNEKKGKTRTSKRTKAAKKCSIEERFRLLMATMSRSLAEGPGSDSDEPLDEPTALHSPSRLPSKHQTPPSKKTSSATPPSKPKTPSSKPKTPSSVKRKVKRRLESDSEFEDDPVASLPSPARRHCRRKM